MRAIRTAMLWLLATVLLAVAVPANWAQHNLIRADGYAALAQRAAADSELQLAVASQLSTQIVSMAGEGSGVNPAVVRAVATSYTRGSAFPGQFAQANRFAHRWLFTDRVRSEVDDQGRWVIDVAPMLSDPAFTDTLAEFNISVPDAIPVPLTEAAPDWARPGALKPASTWGPIVAIGAALLALVFAVATLWSSRRLGRGLISLGVSGLLVGAAGWAGAEVGRGRVDEVFDQLTTDARAAAQALFGTVLDSLHSWLTISLAVGGGLVVVGVIATLLGGLRRAS